MKTQTWTSEGQPVARSFEYWRAVVSEAVMAVEMQRPCVETPFNAEIATYKAGEISITAFSSAAHRIVRTDVNLIDVNAENVLLSLQLSGAAEVTQGKTEFLLRPYEVGLIDLRYPFSINFPQDVRRVIAVVPRASLDTTCASVNGRISGPYAEMICAHLLRMHDVAHVTDKEALLLTCNVQNLLQLALSREGDSRFRPLAAPATNRTADKVAAYIDEHWSDPSLTARKAAQALGVSSRAVHAALHRKDTSFSTLILARRLAESRTRFADASLFNRKICDIVYECGFGDLSHFNRMFKQRFGDTPRQVRTKAGSSSAST